MMTYKGLLFIFNTFTKVKFCDQSFNSKEDIHRGVGPDVSFFDRYIVTQWSFNIFS